jgi:predicted HTH domain antitoxin
MSVVISDEVLQASRLSASELKAEIAVMLFQNTTVRQSVSEFDVTHKN